MQGLAGPMVSWKDPPAPSRPSREFKDSNGISWSVKEVASGGGRSLVFECSYAVRRVREFPPDWMSLSHAKLEELSWHR